MRQELGRNAREKVLYEGLNVVQRAPSRSRPKIREIDSYSLLYEKYEPLGMYDNVIRQLKLTSFNYGWRPKH